MEIWWRFPKFVLGFFLASLIMTVIATTYSLADFSKVFKPGVFGPIAGLRTWAFIFCFLSIGLTTCASRISSPPDGKPFGAFTIGVLVNVILGFLLSVYVFGDYWMKLGK